MSNKYQFMKLGDILVAENIITEDKLTAALAQQKTSKEKLGAVLISQGHINEDDLIKAFSLQTGRRRPPPCPI